LKPDVTLEDALEDEVETLRKPSTGLKQPHMVEVRYE